MGIIAFLIVGALAGWIAGLIIKGRGFGIGGDVIVGIIGALIGGFILRLFNTDMAGRFWLSLLMSIVGALVFLGIASFVKKEV